MPGLRVLAPVAHEGREVTKHQARNVDHQEYVRWIHAQPCAMCGARENIQAAHVGRGGTGMKHGSDAEVIPLCGPRWAPGTVIPGCHAEHDQFRGAFKDWKLSRWRAWNDLQIAVHRGRFEARDVDKQGPVPF
jgi:hypothetical protein